MNRRGKELRFINLELPGDPASEQEMIVEGRPIIFNQRTKLFTLDGLDYFEQFAPTALDGADLRDVVFRYNHSEHFLILARTRGGSLELTPDAEGLWIRSKFFPTTQSRDVYALIKAGIIDKMSFAFTIKEESYNKEERTWTVQKIDRVFDVAAVDQPAYDATSISARKLVELESSRAAALERAIRQQRLKIMATL